MEIHSFIHINYLSTNRSSGNL